LHMTPDPNPKIFGKMKRAAGTVKRFMGAAEEKTFCGLLASLEKKAGMGIAKAVEEGDLDRAYDVIEDIKLMSELKNRVCR